MKSSILILLALSACGSPDAALPEPAPYCAPIDAGPCTDGWRTLATVQDCHGGAEPDNAGACVDVSASFDPDAGTHTWCCP